MCSTIISRVKISWIHNIGYFRWGYSLEMIHLMDQVQVEWSYVLLVLVPVEWKGDLATKQIIVGT